MPTRETRSTPESNNKEPSSNAPANNDSGQKTGTIGFIKAKWDVLLDLWLVLKPCRFSLISLLVGIAFFGLSQQGIDIMRAMIETKPLTSHLFTHSIFAVCVLLWALSIWYWARFIFRYPFIYEAATSGIDKSRCKEFTTKVPVWLAVAAIVTIAAVFFKIGGEYTDKTSADLLVSPGAIGAMYLVAAIFFMVISQVAGPIVDDYLKQHEKGRENKRGNWFGVAIVLLDKNFHFILIPVTLAAFAWTSIDPVGAGKLGTPNLLLIAAANWVFVGTMLVLAGEKLRIPVFTIVLGFAVVFSLVNDNHEIRTIRGVITADADAANSSITTNTASPMAFDDPRTQVNQHFNAWLEARLDLWEQQSNDTGFLKKNGDTSTPSKQRYPFFMVASEGGGIRAAYWTATLLGALQDKNQNFSSHVYAMSGVSGGSLGIATFASMLKAAQDNSVPASIRNNNGDCFSDGRLSFQKCAESMLKEDFLGPVAGRMLYGDLLQRFLFFPVKLFDRAHAIELGWESRWHELTGTRYFEEPLLKLYEPCDNGNGACNIPVMFLNSTWVEEGTRVVSTNIALDENFITIRDLHKMTGRQIPLSTAVHNSARFTFVSPAGTVKNIKDEVIGHLIDGGYYENSGATVIMEVLQSINLSMTKCSPKKRQAQPSACEKQDARASQWARIKPIVLMITNDPKQKDNEIKKANPWINELRSPIEGLLNTRSGRGKYSRMALKSTVEKMNGKFIEFGLQDVNGSVPLGWMLSDQARNTMAKRLKCYMDAIDNNLDNILNNEACLDIS